MDASEEVHRARHRDDPVLDLVAEQASQGEVAEVVGAHMRLEAVGGAGQRQTHHASVVHQHINGFTESANARTLARSARSSSATSTPPDISAAARSAFSMLRQAITTLWPTLGCRGSGRLADTAVAAGDDDPHQRGAYMIRQHCRLTMALATTRVHGRAVGDVTDSERRTYAAARQWAASAGLENAATVAPVCAALYGTRGYDNTVGRGQEVAVPLDPADSGAAVVGGDRRPCPREVADPPVGRGQQHRRVPADVDGGGQVAG